MITSNLLMCTDTIPAFLGIFDFSFAPPLLFYSYIPIALFALIIGIIIFVKDTKSVTNICLLLLSVFFLLYILIEILLWIATPAAIVYLGWSLLILFRVFIIATTVCFGYSFAHQKTPAVLIAVISAFILPAILLLPTDFNVSGFDLNACEGINGQLWYYLYFLEMLAILFFLISSVRYYLVSKTATQKKYSEISFVMFACMCLLVTFSLSTILGNYTLTYEINLIGPIGMLIFLSIIAFMIVKFKTFNIKLIGTQALVITLWFLIGSLLFVVESLQAQIITSLTLIAALIGGYYLINSVKKEVAQREKIELLAKQLEAANERLKVLDKMKSEFVSIASHQLRGPLTSIRGYASMLTEGSYGKLPQKAQEVLEKVVDSAKFMALSIEDYLNVSRIEAGNMKYEMSDFNLKELAEKVVDEMRPVAMKKGLVMVFRSDCSGSCTTHADIGKSRQIIMNLLDNSMKYTPKGTITVVTHDDPKKKKIYVTIQDTGVGMSKETQEEVFDKFVRAKNANQINVTGTGLGLYVAKKMITEMNGRVWAESEGEGTGSTFHIEFPLLPGKSMR